MEILVLAVVLAVVIPVLRGARTRRGMAEVRERAGREGLELIGIERPFWRGGPYWIHRKGDVVFKIKVAGPDGRVREGWARYRPWNYRAGEPRVELSYGEG